MNVEDLEAICIGWYGKRTGQTTSALGFACGKFYGTKQNGPIKTDNLIVKTSVEDEGQEKIVIIKRQIDAREGLITRYEKKLRELDSMQR